MEAALTALLNFSPVQVVAGENLPSGAYYDPRQMTLAVNLSYIQKFWPSLPPREPSEAGRVGKGGRNGASAVFAVRGKRSRAEFLPTRRRFGIQRELPDLTKMAERCQGWEIEDRLAFLKEIQGMSRQIGGSIEKTIAPPQRAAPSRREAER